MEPDEWTEIVKNIAYTYVGMQTLFDALNDGSESLKHWQSEYGSPDFQKGYMLAIKHMAENIGLTTEDLEAMV